jgi:hypothetical protein
MAPAPALSRPPRAPRLAASPTGLPRPAVEPRRVTVSPSDCLVSAARTAPRAQARARRETSGRANWSLTLISPAAQESGAPDYAEMSQISSREVDDAADDRGARRPDERPGLPPLHALECGRCAVGRGALPDVAVALVRVRAAVRLRCRPRRGCRVAVAAGDAGAGRKTARRPAGNRPVPLSTTSSSSTVITSASRSLHRAHRAPRHDDGVRPGGHRRCGGRRLR